MTLETEFTLDTIRRQLPDMPRAVLESQYLTLVEGYIAQQHTIATTARHLNQVHRALAALGEMYGHA